MGGKGLAHRQGSTISPDRNANTSRNVSLGRDLHHDDNNHFAPIRSLSRESADHSEDAAQILERFSAAASLSHPHFLQGDTHPSYIDPLLHGHRPRAESLALSNIRDEDFARSRTGTPALNGTDGEKKDKKSAAFAANERDLRELLDQNKEKTLEIIAREVRSAERTHKSERAKQLFAMRWWVYSRRE